MGNKSVCLDCRIAFSHGMDFNNIISRVCPQCKHEMTNVNYKFRPPKKNEVKKWETVKYLFENGFYYQHIYENGETVKYPETINDARIFVEKYKSQQVRLLVNEAVSK